MRAGVMAAVGRFRVEDVTMIEPGSHDVVVRIRARETSHRWARSAGRVRTVVMR